MTAVPGFSACSSPDGQTVSVTNHTLDRFAFQVEYLADDVPALIAVLQAAYEDALERRAGGIPCQE